MRLGVLPKKKGLDCTLSNTEISRKVRLGVSSKKKGAETIRDVFFVWEPLDFRRPVVNTAYRLRLHQKLYFPSDVWETQAP